MIRIIAIVVVIYFTLVVSFKCRVRNVAGKVGETPCSTSSLRVGGKGNRVQDMALSATLNSELDGWMMSQGCKKEDLKVSLQPFDSAPGGVIGVAIQDLKEKDIIYSIPMGLCLDATKAKTKLSSIIESSQLRTGSLGMLALLILSERLEGLESNYSPYIQSLPTTMKDVPGILGWGKDDLEKLVASTTRRMKDQIQACEADAAALQARQSMLEKVLPAQRIVEEGFESLESAFRWALGVVKSRYVIVDNKPILLPGMDSLTYDPFALHEPFAAGAGIFGGMVVKVFADRDYSAGTAGVCMSFGLKSSAESLEDHGIVPDVPLDEACCEMTIAIDGSEKFVDDKLNILEDNGVPSAGQFDLEGGEDTPIDPELIRFLRIKLITGTDAFILEPVFMNTVFETLDSPFSKANELAVYETLRARCEAAIAQLEAAEREPSTNAERETMLARLRAQELAALKDTVKKANTEIAVIKGPVDPREYYQERRLRELDLLRPLEDDEIFMDGDRPPLTDDY